MLNRKINRQKWMFSYIDSHKYHSFPNFIWRNIVEICLALKMFRWETKNNIIYGKKNQKNTNKVSMKQNIWGVFLKQRMFWIWILDL